MAYVISRSPVVYSKVLGLTFLRMFQMTASSSGTIASLSMGKSGVWTICAMTGLSSSWPRLSA